MLVLTRKLGETIVIGDDIVIKVVDIHGKQIRLGIEAPTEISIFRGEIYDRIQEENKKAQKENKHKQNLPTNNDLKKSSESKDENSDSG
jgi:carbon storage regulator